MKKPYLQHKLSFKPLLAAFLFLLFFSCNKASSEDRGKVGTSAPGFSVTDINGNEYALKNLKGKVVVLNFWFVNCPPCIREIPELNELVEKYKEKDVAFLAFARDSKSKVNKFLAQTNFDYKIIANSGRMTRMFNTHGFPTNIIIDQKGKIVFHEAAYSEERVAQMDGVIASLME